MAEEQWMVRSGDQSIGPVTLESLRFMHDSGKLVGCQVGRVDTAEALTGSELQALIEGSAPVRIAAPTDAVAPPIQLTAPPVQMQPQPILPKDDPLRFVMPIHVNAYALAAGYLGLMATLLVFAPIALVVGILALRDLKRHPESLGAGRAWFGTAMGAVCTVILVVLIVNWVMSNR